MKKTLILTTIICIILIISAFAGCSKTPTEEVLPEPTAVANYNAQYEGSASEFEDGTYETPIVASPEVTESPEIIPTEATTPIPTLAPTVVPNTSTPTLTITPSPTPVPSPDIESATNENEGGAGEWE